MPTTIIQTVRIGPWMHLDTTALTKLVLGWIRHVNSFIQPYDIPCKLFFSNSRKVRNK